MCCENLRGQLTELQNNLKAQSPINAGALLEVAFAEDALKGACITNATHATRIMYPQRVVFFNEKLAEAELVLTTHAFQPQSE